MIEKIINELKAGNQRFTEDKLSGNLQDQTRRETLKSGQSPEVIVLSCSDSRVVPEFIFDKGLGELFVVRVAGNIANTSSVASIEYAVAHLKSKVIVVLGHQSCGAVTAAVAGGDNGNNLNHLLSHINPSISALGKGASVNEVIIKNVMMTAEELKEKSGIISRAVKEGELKIVPAYYHLDSGKVDFL